MGKYSSKYHYHTLQEEFFIILSGHGLLRINGEKQNVSKGYFISKKCGTENPHKFFNSGDIPLEILDIDTVENGDICIYPDKEVYLLRDYRMAFNKNDILPDWSSDPSL